MTNTLKLRVLNPQHHNVLYLFDGKRVKAKGDNMGHLLFEYKTDAAEVELVIVRRALLRSKLWLLWQLLMFIVAIFGLLDLRIKTLNQEAIYRTIINLNESTDIDLRFETSTIHSFVELTTESVVEEIQNAIICDPLIQKRIKMVKILRVVTLITLIIIAIIIALIMNK
ncbi:MAG: hypothetical protein BWX74_00443 [Tenericutes bacterium ADurb.Bin087]|nr:MAG: hypothetical protein BWX74_00443 [Tenericutes bacterium ADurb.Bin087]